MRKLLLLAIMLSLIPFGVSQAVTLNPSQVNIGTVEPGESVQIPFYMTVNGATQNFTVEINDMDPMMSAVTPPNGPVEMSQYSAEDISDWITYSKNEYTVDPTTSETYTIEGNTITAEARAQATISVPEDAEPGYHARQFTANPDFSGGGGGTTVIGLSRSHVTFRVPGEVRREIELSDLQAVRTGEKQLQFVFTYRNTGTVTTRVKHADVNVYDQQGNSLGHVNVPGALVPPGETRRVDIPWVNDEIEGGSYTVEGLGNYTSGEFFIREEVTITGAPREPIDVADPSQQGQQQSPDSSKSGLPIIPALIAVTLISAFMYYAGFEMTWIAAVSGLGIVTIFIIASNAPAYVLLIAYGGAGAMLYIW